MATLGVPARLGWRRSLASAFDRTDAYHSYSIGTSRQLLRGPRSVHDRSIDITTDDLCVIGQRDMVPDHRRSVRPLNGTVDPWPEVTEVEGDVFSSTTAGLDRLRPR